MTVAVLSVAVSLDPGNRSAPAAAEPNSVDGDKPKPVRPVTSRSVPFSFPRST